MFITIVYTSIIADIVLFSGGKYETVAFKNGIMSTVVVTSLTTNKGERGRKK